MRLVSCNTRVGHPQKPASRDRREERGSSYCSVHTLREDDSTYGSHSRGPIQSRLGPHGHMRRQSNACRGSGIHSRLGLQPRNEG
ncbi:hypothetical protein Hanom_Chr04g00300961 [Helianthus anomalus]